MARRKIGSVRRFKDRDGWFIRWKIKGRCTTKYASRTKRGAELLRVRVEARILEGWRLQDAIQDVWNLPDENAVTWRKLIGMYLEDFRLGPYAPTTKRIRGSLVDLAILRTPLARELVPETTRADVARWMDGLKHRRAKKGKNKGNRPAISTLKQWLSAAAGAWRYGQERGFAPEDRNPFSRINCGKTKRLDKNPLLPDEIAAVARHALIVSGQDFYDLYIVASQTGCRASEMTWLERHDVDLDERLIHIRPSHEKTDRGRYVPMTPDVYAIIKRRLDSPGLPTALVLTFGGGHWHHHMRLRLLRRATEAAQAAGELRHHEPCDLQFKGLRDAFCTNMVLTDQPWEIWGKVVGHSTPATSQAYLGKMTDAQKRAMDNFAAVMRAATEKDAADAE